MNLGILLPLGESLTGMREHGQDIRFVKYYLGHYCKNFDKVFVFSYQPEKYENFPGNCELICPKKTVHRYLYGLLLPFIQKKYYRQCDIFRCFHPSAALPATVGKIVFRKKFVFNYNYDYAIWAGIEGKNFLVPMIKLFQSVVFKLADYIFVSDEKMRIKGLKYVPALKITIIRNAVDVNSFRPLAKKNKQNTKLILSVGRLEKQKNYLLLIDAIANLKNKSVKLLLVGKGSLKEDLLKTAKQKEVDLKIIDVVPNNQLPKTYNSADLYVQPSLIEAPVKTLLEAMSCGLPVIASDVPGIRDVIDNGKDGLLAKLDVQDLSSKINWLLSSPVLAKKLGVSARQTIKEKYDLFKFLQLEAKILKSI